MQYFLYDLGFRFKQSKLHNLDFLDSVNYAI